MAKGDGSMDELLKCLQAEFDDGEGWIRVVGADWFADDLKLKVSVQYHDNREAELWEIACTGVAEDSLSASGSGLLTVSAESPLARSFSEPQVEVMFARNAMGAEALLGVVCSCCVEVMGQAETVTRFMNGVATSKGIASSAYGLLGRFPQSVALRILESLADKAIEAHALQGWTPTKWNGKANAPYPPLQVLRIGTSYVIAEQFIASRA